jgi:nucleoside-specific outer membrane channel protein Tsx
MKKFVAASVCAMGMMGAANAFAESPMLWHGESISYLYGKNYNVDPAIQQTVTFEHASGWTWGDLFTFVDNSWYNGTRSSNGHYSLYGEFSPRFSASKLLGADVAFGPIKDVLLATTYEFGEGDVESYLVGPGFDLDIPGFDYFQLNFYYRKPDGGRAPAGAWQITPAWSYTLPVGNSSVLIDGFIDWVVNNKEGRGGNQSDYHANFHFNPQIKYDLGKSLGFEARHLYAGVEYDYWSDKYGIKDSHGFTTDQNTASLLLKYQF